MRGDDRLDAPRIAEVCLEKKADGTRMGFNGKVPVRLPKEVCVQSEKQCVVAEDYERAWTCADAWREAGTAEASMPERAMIACRMASRESSTGSDRKSVV